MGTSISQASPRNTNWSPVHTGYKSEFVSEERIISEIWRASENQEIPISQSIASESIYECYAAVRNSPNFQEAVEKFSEHLADSKSNSIVAEFAKRAIPAAYQSERPAEAWASRFFSEVTNYMMSRDLSGFVGGGNRNKTVTEMINFKKNITNKVSEIVGSGSRNIKNNNDWKSFVSESIDQLKSTK
jgi:hypothetical protein